MKRMQRSFSRVFLFMLAGPMIWAAHFLFIYSVHGVACARPMLYGAWLGAPVSAWIIVAASVLALAAMGLIFLRLRTRLRRSGDRGFPSWMAAALSLLSALAIVWETIPVLLVPAC